MTFISSQVSLLDLPDTKEEIYNMEWFLFHTNIRSKEDAIREIHDYLIYYSFFYRQKVYVYLMTDKYYWKTDLFNTIQDSCCIRCMSRVKEFDEIKDWDTEFIKSENRIFGENDIKQMMDLMEKNNFRENQICEYVLG